MVNRVGEGGRMTAAYTTTSDFAVGPSQTLQVTDQDGAWLSPGSSGRPPNLSIEGGLAVIATSAYSGAELYGVRATGDFTGAQFTLGLQSQVRVIEDQVLGKSIPDLAVYGLVATASPNITIGGTILVAATGPAIGIVAPFSSLAGGLTLTQGGVEAVSNLTDAYGIRMDFGGTFHNSFGFVEAHAHTVAVGVTIGGDHGSFYNKGSIVADSDGAASGGYGVAVEWRSAATAGTSGAFTNDGTLRGDYALVVKADVVNPAAVQTFTNNAAMVGKVDLGDAPARLINNGWIDGEVTFGGSSDLYDGHAGSLHAPVYGGGGNDTMLGGSGAESFVVGDGANYLRGGDGHDTIVGGAGFNNVNGNQGDDSIIGRSTVGDWLLGGQGNDHLDASASTGANVLNGNLGADSVTGGSHGDTLRGGQGDDLIHGGSGNDLIFGDLGQNTISGGAGADTFHSGAGAARDLISDFNRAEGDRVQIAPGLTYTTSQAGADVRIEVSNGDTIVLQNTQLSSLTDGWLIQA